MHSLFALLEVGLAVLAVVAVHQAHRRARAAFPEAVVDAAHPALAGWRWAAPPDGLDVRQTADDSILILPTQPRTGLQIGGVLMGYGVLLLSVVMLIQGLRIHDNVWIPILVTPVFALIGLGMINLDARLERIVLGESHVRLILRYGLRFHRQIRLKRRARLKIRGGYISVFEMTADQEQPEYRLRLGRHAVLSACNQTQGSWIIAGLKQWAGST
jgi:hypothetical protein